MDFYNMSHDEILRILPERKSDCHKGDCGKVLLLCGSKGYTGAAALSAMGALRCGAGLVYLAVPECIYFIEAAKLVEPVVIPLSGHDNTFSVDAAGEVEHLLDGKDAVLIGPGIGCTDGTLHMLETVLQKFSGPVVVDADGINLLQHHRDLLRGRKEPTVLTPHMGEFRRIGGNLELAKCDAAVALAQDLGATILLKGHKTVITDGTCCYINDTGNPGMAVGGSGDLLAGIITALLGFGISPLHAAACGAWLHGAAGDICAAEIGQYGMLPSDMLEVLPRLLK